MKFLASFVSENDRQGVTHKPYPIPSYKILENYPMASYKRKGWQLKEKVGVLR